ncbi:hypothetical protein DAQ1742_03652 [Dickeya aquatica]|uniref:Uncharacterized protein n=1 Tax=Dickeya aquatica TaxID=1401087 RepID=A0A375AEW2_9GAMM|nr:hypothetical protein DAQ1742_03652 [Dickeya aquatica]
MAYPSLLLEFTRTMPNCLFFIFMIFNDFIFCVLAWIGFFDQ